MARRIYLDLNGSQGNKQSSFIGGKPWLPKDVSTPFCELCNKEMTFYFQIAFPEDHLWCDHTFSMWACTKCADKNHLIPRMIQPPLKDAVIPPGFLREYQKNFRTLVFATESAHLLEGYEEKIQFGHLHFDTHSSEGVLFGLIGFEPEWILEDESPATYGDKRLHFLFQTYLDIEFPILNDAKQQAKVDLGLTIYDQDYYELFIQNGIYFFGLLPPANEVYILTQVD